MEKQIFKYTLEVTDKQFISLPKGSEILTIQTQFNEPQLWVLSDPSGQEKEERCIEMFGTGKPVYCGMGLDRKYLSTYQLEEGNYVFHVFERL